MSTITWLLHVLVPFIFLNDILLLGLLIIFPLMMFHVVFTLLEEFTKQVVMVDLFSKFNNVSIFMVFLCHYHCYFGDLQSFLLLIQEIFIPCVKPAFVCDV